MYGWKGRIGLLLPARNTTLEPEFCRMAPDGVSVHAARVTVGDVNLAGLREMEKDVTQAASLVAQVNPQVIIVGCTSGSFVGGFGYDQKLSAEISRLTGIKAITTSTAVIEALKLLKIKKVAVATPYIDEVNDKEKEFIEANGIAVTRIQGLGYSKAMKQYPLADKPVSLIGLLDPAVAYKLAMDVNSAEAEGIFISCTNFRTIEIIAALERNTGKPVISSNQAAMAIGLKSIGVRDPVCGFGSLFGAE